MDEPTRNTPPSLRDRWMARLAGSFLVVGVALAFQGFKLLQRGATGWQPWTELIGSACAFAMGFLGVRIRHRRTGDSAN